MPLTQIFSILQPHDDHGDSRLRARAHEIASGMAETVAQGGDTGVLRALNEFGEIAKLNSRYTQQEDCRAIYETLAAAGYEADVFLGEHFTVDDADQMACYLIGQAMAELGAGNPPPGIFLARSSMALNGVPYSDWQRVINREILMM